MEALAVRPTLVSQEVDRYRRTYNDVTTWLAETLDGSMRTPFEYTSDGQELYAEDGGALGPIFETAIADAKAMVARDPSLHYELRRRRLEMGELLDMYRMARGELPNTMVVESDFPPELMRATEDVGGYNVTRKPTMLRVITWQAGRLTMYSQSLDGSNRAGLEAIQTALGQQPQAGELLGQRIHLELDQEEQTVLLDRLMGIYDRSLEQQFGGSWYAGRRGEPRDTYQFVLGQTDVIDRLVARQLSGSCTARDIYNTAALLRDLFEGQTTLEPTGRAHSMGAFAVSLEAILQAAGQRAQAAGQVFSGCGASLSAKGQLSEAGYGGQNDDSADDDNFGSLSFTCPSCHRTNTRRRGKLLASCQHCGSGKVAC